MDNKFILGIGPWKFAVESQYEATKKYCARYLTEGQPDHFIHISTDDLQRELEIFKKQDPQYQERYHAAIVESFVIQRKVTEYLFDHNVLLFHGSAIAVDGQTYLFIAKSGTGKSTHTALWRQLFGDRAVMVNDDKPFLAISNAGVQVIGSPWNGVHRQGNNITLPLKAICILERSETNKIQKISFRESLFMLLQQSKCPTNDQNKYMELIETLAQTVPFYRLKCNMDIEAAQVAYEAMHH